MRCYTVACSIHFIMARLYRAEAPRWDAKGIRALRRHLGLTQEDLAQELGVRQQTVSEWETGLYRPRGAARRMLHIIAERSHYPYTVSTPSPESEETA